MDNIEKLAPLMGMDVSRLQNALQLLEREAEEGRIPGGTAAIGRNGYVVEHAFGVTSVYGGESTPVRTDTIYDCASLTKVAVTLPLLLLLLEEGRVRLDDPLAVYLPEGASSPDPSVTVGRLLTHTAGLAAFANMYSQGWTRDQIIDFALRHKPACGPGERVLYSDLGFLLLGHLVSVLYGEPLETAAARRVFEPLEMKDTLFCPPADQRGRIAPTEWYPSESGPRQGVVHDENAYAMGGVSGHAGLFSTAHDLARYASMWLGEGSLDGVRLLSPAAVRLATRNHTGSIPGGSRGLGWSLKGDPFDASGDLLSDRSYGHTGFTGTSLYVDPELRLAVVLLTNRVHLGRDHSIGRLRGVFHNAVAAALADR